VNLSKEVRRILDEAGFEATKIFVSGGLDEYTIGDYLEEGGVADFFGIGSSMVTSDDAPKIDIVYKLVESEENGKLIPKMKIAEGEKITLPGAKQVFRIGDEDKYVRDIIGLSQENLLGEKKLVQIFKNGELLYKLPTLDKIRERAQAELRKLPDECRRIRNPATYPVEVSRELLKLTERMRKNLLA
jgi:nicotinate phosphoribosyltransferase